MKTIVENNRKANGNSAIPIRVDGFCQRWMSLDIARLNTNRNQNLVTNPSLNPRKPTGFGGQHFLYWKVTSPRFFRHRAGDIHPPQTAIAHQTTIPEQ
jgi:hypothetical protein